MTEQLTAFEKFATGVIARIVYSVSVVLNLAVSVNNFVGQPHWVWLIAAGGPSVAICIFVIFKKRNIGARFNVENFTPLYPKWLRILSGIVLAVMFVLVVCLILPRPWTPNRFEILVADIEGPSQYGLTEKIIEDLRRGTEGYPGIEIKAARKVISAQDGSEVARAIGEDRHANIVVWGWYRATDIKATVTIHCELLNVTPSIWLKSDIEGSKHPQRADIERLFPLAKLKTFEVQETLGEDISSLALYFVACQYFDKSDYDETIRILSKSLRQDKSLGLASEVRYMRAYCLFETAGSPTNLYAAIDDLTGAIAQNPNFANAYGNRAGCYLRLSDYVSALSDCERGLQISPKSGLLLANESCALCGLGRFDEALRVAREACQTDPTSSAYRTALAESLWKDGQVEDAISEFTKVIQSESDNGLALSRRTELYRLEKKFKEAHEDCSRLFNFPRYEQYARWMQALIFGDEGNYRRCLDEVNLYLTFDAESVKAHYLRGKTYAWLNDYDRAIGDLNFVIANKDKFFGAPIASVYNLLGEAYVEKGNYSEARRNLVIAKTIDEKDYVADREFGLMLFNMRNYVESLVPLSKAIEENTNDAAAYSIRGAACVHLERYRDAISDLNKAITLESNDFPSYTFRGVAYWYLRKENPAYVTNALFDCRMGIKGTNDVANCVRAKSLRAALISAGLKP